MNRCKKIFCATLIIIMIFVIYSCILAYKCYNTGIFYPTDTMSASINGWTDLFFLKMKQDLKLIGIPLLLDVLLFIMACFRLKRDRAR